MATSINMRLEKPAQKGGGDKYVGSIEGTEISFYVPQSVSRATGMPIKAITITIHAGG